MLMPWGDIIAGVIQGAIDIQNGTPIEKDSRVHLAMMSFSERLTRIELGEEEFPDEFFRAPSAAVLRHRRKDIQ